MKINEIFIIMHALKSDFDIAKDTLNLGIELRINKKMEHIIH